MSLLNVIKYVINDNFRKSRRLHCFIIEMHGLFWVHWSLFRWTSRIVVMCLCIQMAFTERWMSSLKSEPLTVLTNDICNEYSQQSMANNFHTTISFEYETTLFTIAFQSDASAGWAIWWKSVYMWWLRYFYRLGKFSSSLTQRKWIESTNSKTSGISTKKTVLSHT